MKLKLAGLLLFSQAAQSTNPTTPEESARFVGAAANTWHITEQNYRGKMCGDDLFEAPPELPDGKYHVSLTDTNAAKSKVASIKIEHDAYCYASTQYEKAVKDKKEGKGTPAYADMPITKNGMIVATACEQLKVQKKMDRPLWDSYFSTPKPCPSWSRR